MKKYLPLFLIVALFLFTRIHGITQNPPSVYWDEASIGYNAYSILKTGHDEWGRRFPIHFRAFGEFKLPVYIYSVVVTESLFGLNNFSVRLPAVLFSVGSVALLYLITFKIYKDKWISTLTAFLFSISPWDFIFSRAGYEASAGLMFFLLGFSFFLHASQKRWLIFFGTVSLILSLYSYNSFRILTPLTLIMMMFLTLKDQFNRKTLLISGLALVMFAISLVPIARLMIYDAGFGRTQGFSLFPSIQQVYDLTGKPHFQIIFDRSKSTDWTSNILTFGRNYLDHLNPKLLFIKGDPNPRSQVPGFGQIFWIDLPMLILGLTFVFKHLRHKNYFLPLILLLIAPIPAALFKESPHALRAILMAPALSIISALGLAFLYKKMPKVSILVSGVYLVFFGVYFYNFSNSYSQKTSKDWQYGYKLIFDQYRGEFANFDHVIISDQEAQPYIFVLYYLKYDPTKFIKEANYNPVSNWGFSTVRSFDNFIFEKIDAQKFPNGKLLVFSTPQEKINSVPVKQIKNLDGSLAFNVYELTK